MATIGQRVGALVAVAALAGCGQQAQGDAPVVFAASSLSTVLPHLDDTARFSFDGSTGLLDQLRSGARADVFVSADHATMLAAAEEGLLDGEPVMVATNRLVLVVPADNPARVTGFDGSLADTRLVVCAPEVPCGSGARRLAEAAGVRLDPVSEELKVTDVLGKVASGEADAGIVYATDAALASDAVTAMEIPGAAADPNTYWAGVVAQAPHPEGAEAFVAALAGPWQADLRAAGFGPPR